MCPIWTKLPAVLYAKRSNLLSSTMTCGRWTRLAASGREPVRGAEVRGAVRTLAMHPRNGPPARTRFVARRGRACPGQTSAVLLLNSHSTTRGARYSSPFIRRALQHQISVSSHVNFFKTCVILKKSPRRSPLAAVASPSTSRRLTVLRTASCCTDWDRTIDDSSIHQGISANPS